MEELDAILAWTKDLVAISSLSGEESSLAEYIYSQLQSMDVSCYVQENNVVAYRSVGSRSCLVFNVHMDTVQPTPNWVYNPYTLVQEENRLYGLGVSDEKISIAILLSLLQDLPESSCDVYVCFVTEEETTGAGSKRFVEHFLETTDYDDVSCVLTEPTASSYVEIGHRGRILVTLQVTGPGGHASRPEKTVNPVHILNGIFAHYEDYIQDLESDEELGKSTIAAPTTISASGSTNAIPTSVTATMDVRTTRLTHQDLVKELSELPETIHISQRPPSVTDRNARIVSLTQKLGVTDVRYAIGGDDSVFFTERGIPCVVFGAGSLERIHQADEYCEVRNILPAKKFYERLLQEY
ncbi:MAG: M20 family metallopeptidase [Candidatus Woesearchaeota archaeon]